MLVPRHGLHHRGSIPDGPVGLGSAYRSPGVTDMVPGNRFRCGPIWNAVAPARATAPGSPASRLGGTRPSWLDRWEEASEV